MSEWGNPTPVRALLRSEHIGPVEGTAGIETSQYREEKKTTRDSVSSGERKRISLNRSGVIAWWRCHFGVVGPIPTAPEVGPSYKVAA